MAWELKWSSGANGNYSTYRYMGTYSDMLYITDSTSSSSSNKGYSILANIGNTVTVKFSTNTSYAYSRWTKKTGYSNMRPLPSSAPTNTYTSIYYANITYGEYVGTWAWVYYQNSSSNTYTSLYRYEPDGLKNIAVSHYFIPLMITDSSGICTMDVDSVYECIDEALSEAGDYDYTHVNGSYVTSNLSGELYEAIDSSSTTYPFTTKTYTSYDKKYKIYATIPSGSSYVYYYVSLNSGPEMSVKVGGSWKTGTPYVKVGGVWKQADAVYVKVNGVWKQST